MSDAKKKILYEQFTEKSNEVKEQQELGEKYGVSADRIVIKKESAGAKILSISYSLVAVFLKIITGGILIGLISFALTVLINTELRNAVFEIIKTW